LDDLEVVGTLNLDDLQVYFFQKSEFVLFAALRRPAGGLISPRDPALRCPLSAVHCPLAIAIPPGHDAQKNDAQKKGGNRSSLPSLLHSRREVCPNAGG
jgi:hypothetical protein